MSEEGLAQEGHGSDQVQFMNAVLVPVIVDEEGQGSLRRICDTGTNPVALKTCITWDGTGQRPETTWLPAQSAPCSKLLRAQPPRYGLRSARAWLMGQHAWGHRAWSGVGHTCVHVQVPKIAHAVKNLALMPANGVRVRAAIRTWVTWVSALLAALDCCSLSVTGGISAAGLCGSSEESTSSCSDFAPKGAWPRSGL